MDHAKLYTISVVYGTADKQTILPLTVTPNTRVREAIDQSGLPLLWPDIDLDTIKIGIFSKKVNPETKVSNGDRIELYRPLKIDPKQARKLRASKISLDETKRN